MNYIEINKNLWNNRTDVHVKSKFYNVEKFKQGMSSLHKIELDLLGDVKGKSILHLQCHFGQDTLSLARLGAHVTGMDLSDRAIDFAKQLSAELNLDAEFICCDMYDLKLHLDKKFDIVFTSYGVIGWLPDLNKWADIVAHFLNPGGLFVFAEFHPLVWMFDDAFAKIKYSYFNIEEILDDGCGTYTDRDANISNISVSWNHNLAEVFSALLKNNLRILSFNEFDYSPYNSFRDMVEIEKNKFQIKGMEGKIPMVYSIRASKPK